MGPNAAVSFLLEVAALAVYGWVPFGYLSSLGNASKVTLSLMLIAATIWVWAKYAAPRSDTRLKGWRLIACKACVFLPAGVLIGMRLGTLALITSILIVCLNLGLEWRASTKTTAYSPRTQ